MKLKKLLINGGRTREKLPKERKKNRLPVETNIVRRRCLDGGMQLTNIFIFPTTKRPRFHFVHRHSAWDRTLTTSLTQTTSSAPATASTSVAMAWPSSADVPTRRSTIPTPPPPTTPATTPRTSTAAVPQWRQKTCCCIRLCFFLVLGICLRFKILSRDWC